MLESITNFAQQSGPLSLMVLLVGCSFGLPLAKSLIIVAAGVLAGLGNTNPLWWFLACAVGLHLGDFFLFLIGRQWGERVFEWKPIRKLVKVHHLQKAKALISRHGAASLLLARITPFVRTACYLLLGTLRMDPFKFTAINLTVSSAYTGVFFTLGFFLGNRPETLRSWAGSWNLIIAVILFIATLIMLRFPNGQFSRFNRSKNGMNSRGKPRPQG